MKDELSRKAGRPALRRGRPKCKFKIGFHPEFGSYKPTGVACCEYIEINGEELESLRLKNIKNLDQIQAARKMGVSQSTFQRILKSAYRKISVALIEGRELRIAK